MTSPSNASQDKLPSRGITRGTAEFYRAEWKGKRNAFAAGQHAGMTIVVAKGRSGGLLREFVKNELGGTIERPSKPKPTLPDAA